MLATLRRVRRTVAGAVASALLVSGLAGAACPAVSAAAPIATHSAHGTSAASHHEHAAHEQRSHEHGSIPPPQPTGDCPHCLGGHTAGNVTTGDCDVVAAAGPIATDVLAAAKIVLSIASHEEPAASAVPPLIQVAAHAISAPASSVPLHIRHCVLLI